MFYFYGIAKRLYNRGETTASQIVRVLAVVIPATLHGIYDYIATMQTDEGSGYFLV